MCLGSRLQLGWAQTAPTTGTDAGITLLVLQTPNQTLETIYISKYCLMNNDMHRAGHVMGPPLRPDPSTKDYLMNLLATYVHIVFCIHSDIEFILMWVVTVAICCAPAPTTAPSTLTRRHSALATSARYQTASTVDTIFATA